jgi:hypothetical protein
MVAAGPLVFVQVVSKIGCPGLASTAVPERVIEFAGQNSTVSFAGVTLTVTVGWAIPEKEKKILKVINWVIMVLDFIIALSKPLACQS